MSQANFPESRVLRARQALRGWKCRVAHAMAEGWWSLPAADMTAAEVDEARALSKATSDAGTSFTHTERRLYVLSRTPPGRAPAPAQP